MSTKGFMPMLNTYRIHKGPDCECNTTSFEATSTAAVDATIERELTRALQRAGKQLTTGEIAVVWSVGRMYVGVGKSV